MSFKEILKEAKGDLYYFDKKTGTHKIKEIQSELTQYQNNTKGKHNV